MKFQLFGIRCTARFGFFLVVALYMALDESGMGLPALAAVLLHEMGHLWMLRFTGSKIPAVDFQPFGVRLLVQRGGVSVGQETLIYLGGILMNALCLLLWTPWRGWDGFALANGGLLIFNLLPVGRLDGGQLVRLALENRFPPHKAVLFHGLIGMGILLPLGVGGWLLLMQGNPTLLCTVVYLALTIWNE